MLKAVVKEPFRGVRDGEIHPEQFNKGDSVEGNLAEVAIAQGWAKKAGAKEEAPATPANPAAPAKPTA